MIARGPSPTITIERARASTTRRLERDVEIAAWCGMDHGEFVAFINRVEQFDANTRALEMWRSLQDELEAQRLLRDVEDSRPAMLARVDKVIADLVEDLIASGYFAETAVAR